MKKNRYTRLLSNTVIFAVGKFFSTALSYLMIPFYTMCLTAGQSDASDLIQQISNFIMPVAAIGICETLLRYTIDAGERKKEIFSSCITVMTAGSVILIILSPVLLFLDRILNDWNISYSILIVVFVLCANFQMAVSYYIRSLGFTKLYAIQGIVNTALTAGLNVIFLGAFRWGEYGFVLAITISNLLVTVWLIIQKRLWNDFSLKLVKFKLVKELLLYGLPLIPTTLLWSLTNITDKLIVREAISREANGLFVYAYKIPTVLTLLTTVFIEAWQLSAVNDSSEGKDRGSFFEEIFRSYSSLIFLAASGLILLIHPLSDLLLSADYEAAWIWMPTLICATVFSAFSTFLSTVYMVSKKSMFAFLTALCGSAVNIVFSLLLVRRYEVQGVCIATVFSYIVLFVIRYITALKYINFKINIPRLIINSVLVFSQAALQVLSFPEDNSVIRICIQTAFCVIIALFNLKPLLHAAKTILSSLFSRKKAG